MESACPRTNRFIIYQIRDPDGGFALDSMPYPPICNRTAAPIDHTVYRTEDGMRADGFTLIKTNSRVVREDPSQGNQTRPVCAPADGLGCSHNWRVRKPLTCAPSKLLRLRSIIGLGIITARIYPQIPLWSPLFLNRPPACTDRLGVKAAGGAFAQASVAGVRIVGILTP